MPKSGEQDDHTAPIEAAASTPTMLSGILGMMAATRSPTLTPASRSACAARATSVASSRQLMRRLTLSSPQNTRASPSLSLCLSRFSAKFSRAPGKNRAPGILSPSTR